MMKPKERIIVALDVGNMELCRKLLTTLYPTVKMFKIGGQLFTMAGQEAVSAIKRKGAWCFLDLKFHDIPATVGKAAASATRLGVDIFDVHAQGGLEMMKRAVGSSAEIAAKLNMAKPRIIAVTVLTSMNKKNLSYMGVSRDPKEQVLFLAELAKKAGCDGVVASPDEIGAVKKNIGEDFIVITPGIRPSWAEKADQKRVATPKEAVARGADYIVIGRPITETHNPKGAAERIIGEIE
jgi:orotidine-5'-phosphate decarboxylase